MNFMYLENYFRNFDNLLMIEYFKNNPFFYRNMHKVLWNIYNFVNQIYINWEI